MRSLVLVGKIGPLWAKSATNDEIRAELQIVGGSTYAQSAIGCDSGVARADFLARLFNYASADDSYVLRECAFGHVAPDGYPEIHFSHPQNLGITFA